MTTEVVGWLEPTPESCLLDCTVGGGGHSRALLDAGAGRVIGLDRDRDALTLAASTLSAWSDRVELVHTDYRRLDEVLDARDIDTIDGAVADLGLSSLQLEGEARGFSFRRDEPLDMRMDQSRGATAADLLRDVSERKLADIIFQYGEERHSRRIARGIVEHRFREPITTTGQLATLIRRGVPRRGHTRIDPATRTFQALRIWVNDELAGVERFLRAVVQRLRSGARVVVLSFHSLEDRIVKTVFHELSGREGDAAAIVRVLTKRPLRPSETETAHNPRARSAKLRAAERLA
jgi:16S rRNA (cytosine1402-N4)-methyltransferase